MADAADVEIVASVAADRVRFDARPQVRVAFPGAGKRDSRQLTQRQNIDTPVEPGRTYRRVSVETRIRSRFLNRGSP